MFKVFWSWMVDRPPERNRVVIAKALREGMEELCQQPDIALAADGWEIVECGRQQESGDIVSFITQTLPQCQAHVVDVTFINEPQQITSDTRLTPNPNNMLETGYSLCCLTPSRVIPVFNREYGSAHERLGRVDLLPFDIQHHNVIVYNGPSERARLKNDLKNRLTGIVEEYRCRWPELARGCEESLGRVLHFFDQFLHVHSGSEIFVKASLATLDPQSGLAPDRDLLRLLLVALRPRNPADRLPEVRSSEVQWGHIFLVLLRCLHSDCRRLLHRFRRLEGTSLFRQVERIGQEADHLESVCDRVFSNAPHLLGEGLVVDEMSAFLDVFKQTRRELFPYLHRPAVVPEAVSTKQ